MRKLSIAILIAAIAVMVALAGCGGGGGGPTSPVVGPTGNTIITGTVVDDRSPARPVKDVIIDLGALETRTDAAGKFRFDLGFAVRLADYLGSNQTDWVFKVSTSAAGTYYPQVAVFYLQKIPGTGHPQENGSPASITLPFEVLMASGITKDLGQVIVQYYDPNDPTFPPIPY